MQLAIDGWQIDLTARIARRNDISVQLSPRAIRLLQVLVSANGAVVSRDELLGRVWPNVFVSDESLTQVVSELRRKLGNRELIATVARGGYRLTVSVCSTGKAMPKNLAGSLGEIQSLEAHALCLEASNALVRCRAGALELGERLTAEAVDLAPKCASVLAERAVALLRCHLYWSDGRDTLESALSYARLAVEADPSSAAAHSALGYAYSAAGHWQAADSAHCQALSADPHRASSYNLAAWHLMRCGRLRPAIQYFEQVGDLEPLNIKGYLQAAQLCWVCDPPRSQRNCERALKRVRQRLEVDPYDMRALVALVLLMALMGEMNSAYSAIQTLDVSGSAQGIYLASALSILGETDRALLVLEELFDHGWRDVYWLVVDPAFNTISGDRRFSTLRESALAA